MNTRLVDPSIQALLDETALLPECGARDALLEQVATRAEALQDLDTAWDARCKILSSSTCHEAPRFETLFMNLAWCLAMSDHEPDRFAATDVLWQYKWVATEAPLHASVPRAVLVRIVEDLDARFKRQGWGVRAGLHKRMDVYSLLGDHQKAMSLVQPWLDTPRDRGSDCQACEVDSLVRLYAGLRADSDAVRHAKPIMRGRLSCATVPHSTFGVLLAPLMRLGRNEDARTIYDRGRRLLAATDEGNCKFAAPYFHFAAYIGDTDIATALLRTRFRQALSLQADLDRLDWFGRGAAALRCLRERGFGQIEAPRIARYDSQFECDTSELEEYCHAIASDHAEALDNRNGNAYYSRWLSSLHRIFD